VSYRTVYASLIAALDRLTHASEQSYGLAQVEYAFEGGVGDALEELRET
jgi:hypothetical protein